MRSAKDPEVYPKEFRRLLERFQESPEARVRLPFSSRKAARRFVYRFYGWRESERKRDAAVTQTMYPLFQLVLRRDGNDLVVENGDANEDVKAIQAGLQQEEAT